MTTNKEQQEAVTEMLTAKDADLLRLKTSCDNLAKLAEESRAEIESLRAKLTSQVASGEAVAIARCYKNENGILLQELRRTRYGMDNLKDGDAVYLHPPTPSPSNVLVEALRDIASGKWTASTQQLMARNALAAYSAPSTDSVSISRSKYEAMLIDAKKWREQEKRAINTLILGTSRPEAIKEKK